ncbi:MAG TPA: ribbon-helix-helix protein, CopG family [Gaiellaceae bacterium]|jgi:predicted transcriptional regulator
MRKTTVYLPDELKERVERVARAQQRSEAEVIRSALADYTARERPRPKAPLVRGSGRTNVAETVDELLQQGFGRR